MRIATFYYTRLGTGFASLALTIAFNYGCKANDSVDAKPHCATTTNSFTLEDGGITLSGTKNHGLLLTTTENYSSSRLFYFDLTTGKKTQLLSGESGDPAVFSDEGELFFFNRTSSNSNLRTLSIADGSFDLGVQTAIPGAGYGDPQDLIHLDESHLLLSFWDAHTLGIFDLESCSLKETVDLAFDIGSGDDHVFRPSSLFKASADSNTVYVLHQGLSSDGLTVNGSQQLFPLHWDGSTLTADDLHAETDLIQGIPLQVSNPTGIYQTNDTNKPVVIGSCSLLASGPCKGGFEAVDLAAHTSEIIFDTSEVPEKNNGGVVQLDDHTFLMQLAKPDDTATVSGSVKTISKVDTTSKTVTTFFTYPAASGGYSSFFYDEGSGSYVVTDYTAEQGGTLSILDGNGATTASIAVENTPYGGIFIP